MTTITPTNNATTSSKENTMTSTTTIEHLDPASLLVDRNVRGDLQLSKDFVASIKENGVIVPLVAVRATDGIRVRAGHRRTAAAVQAGLATVPVMILEADDDQDQDEQARLITQIVENHHRTGLTTVEQIAAIEQLTAFGVKSSSIVKKTRLDRRTVKHAAQAAKASDEVRNAIAQVDTITLEEAAWLQEVEEAGDAAFLERLVNLLSQGHAGQARHHLEMWRNDKIIEDARELAAQQLRQQGFTVADRDEWDQERSADPWDLRDLTEDGHQQCPGHTVWLRRRWDESGEVRIEQEGRKPVSFDVEWGCADWEANGHTKPSRLVGRAKSTPNASDEERAEAQRQARRQTIRLNKAGEAALRIRSEWLTAFSRQTKPPADAAEWLMDNHAHHERAWGHNVSSGWKAFCDAVGTDNPMAKAKNAGHRLHLLLCAKLWDWEAEVDREVWRSHRKPIHYLESIEAWGYSLGYAELVTVGRLTEEQAYGKLTEAVGESSMDLREPAERH